MEYPISLDTALAIVGSMKVQAIKSKDGKTGKEEQQIVEKIYMYAMEEKLLYGADDYARLSVMDKVVNLYSPILKKQYAEGL